MDRKKIIIVWTLQIICAGILLFTSLVKLTSHPNSIFVFTELGMEPTGRYIIGVIELIIAISLLTSRLAAAGAFLALGTMLGAIIAHISVLGANVLGDGGRHLLMLGTVIGSAITIVIIRRRQIPLIGNTFR